MKNIYLLIIAICAFNTSAQKFNTSIPENNMELLLNTNATSFIAGETLYYKIYLASNNTVAKDKIGYAVLVGSDKNAVFTHKHFLTDGSAHGDFFIPASIETGSYKLIVYSANSLNSSKQLFERNIIIVNPFHTSKIDENATELSVAEELKLNSPFNLTQQTNYKNRELVVVNTTDLPLGKYSISVRKADQLDRASVNITSSDRMKKPVEILKITPEIRGEVISGQATLNTLPAKMTNIALSIAGENPVFKIVKTDAEGKFIFTIPQMNPNSQIFIQALSKGDENHVIDLDKSLIPNFSALEFPNFRVPQILESDLRERMVAVQIRNSYVSSKADTIVPQPLAQKFYEPIAKEYILDKYTRFPTFAQTIVELLPEVYYLKDGAKFTVHVRDNNIGRTIPETSLVLVDGILLQDATELFSFPMRNVEKIDIVTGIYLYGPAAFNGLISITTKNNNYEPKSLKAVSTDIIRPFVEKKYYRQQHNENSKRTPDFRQQLLWSTNISNKETASFYTSDLTGNFKIEISGVTSEGQVFTTSKMISVTEN